MVPSLKDQAAAEFIRTALARLQPAVIVTATAFAAAAGGGEPTPFDDVDVPVLQAVIATTRRSAWSQSPRGLGPADLAMHVLLPELDGRVLQGVIAFKGPLPTQKDLCFTALGSLPEADRSNPWPTKSRRWSRCRRSHGLNGASRFCCRTIQAHRAGPAMPLASTCPRALSRCCRIWKRRAMPSPARRKAHAHSRRTASAFERRGPAARSLSRARGVHSR